MALGNIAAGLFNFDPTQGLQRGTQMGAQMMEIALREQKMKMDAAAQHANAALSAERNALARRTQLFSELTDALNRHETRAKEQQAAAWNASVVGGAYGGGSGGSGAGGVAYPSSSSVMPEAATVLPEGPAYTESTGFNTAPAVDPAIPTAMPDQPRNLSSDFWVGGGQPQPIGGAPSSSGPQSFLSSPEGSFNATDPLPTQSGQVTEDKVGQSFMGGGQMVRQDGRSQPQSATVADVPVNPGAHRIRADVAYDGRPANVRYNNPGASYPRPADDAYGLEGYGVIGGGHLIGKYPTPVHGAASNMDLFSKGYKGMTIGAAVRKWRGGNGSLNVPAGYDPRATIDDRFLSDKGTMVDFFEKMASHESSRFSMPREGWESAFDMYQAGGVGGGQPQGGMPAPGGGIDAGLFPASAQLQQQGQQQAEPDYSRFPEYRALQEVRGELAETTRQKAENVADLSDLRNRDFQIQASMGVLDRSDPGYNAQRLILGRELAGVRARLKAAEDWNREILGQERTLQKSMQDANAAWKIVHDRDQIASRFVQADPPRTDPEQIVDQYIQASPLDRMKIKSRFENDPVMKSWIANTDDFLKQEADAAKEAAKTTEDGSRTWKIGGSEYTFDDLVRHRDAGAVFDFLEKDPKLKAEVEAAAAGGGAPQAPSSPSSLPPSQREGAISTRLQSEAASLFD